jgi:gas vesicle protein
MSKEVSDILRAIASSFAELQEAIEEQQAEVQCDIKNLQYEVDRNRDAIKAAANSMLAALE